MKRIAPFVFIAFAAIGLLGTPSTAFALKNNCFGIYSFPDALTLAVVDSPIQMRVIGFINWSSFAPR